MKWKTNCISHLFTEKAGEKKSSCWHKYLRNETAVLVDIFLCNTERGKWENIYTSVHVEMQRRKAGISSEQKPRGRRAQGAVLSQLFLSFPSMGWKRGWGVGRGLWAMWFLSSVLVFLISKQLHIVTNIKNTSHLSHMKGGCKSPFIHPASCEYFSERRILFKKKNHLFKSK